MGEAGGVEAAALLHETVLGQIIHTVPDVPPEVRMLVRIYADLKRLGDTLYRTGVIDHPSRVEEFAKGFTSGPQSLFDFVDVGSGKSCADKLSGAFGSAANATGPFLTLTSRHHEASPFRFSLQTAFHRVLVQPKLYHRPHGNRGRPTDGESHHFTQRSSVRQRFGQSPVRESPIRQPFQGTRSGHFASGLQPEVCQLFR